MVPVGQALILPPAAIIMYNLNSNSTPLGTFCKVQLVIPALSVRTIAVPLFMSIVWAPALDVILCVVLLYTFDVKADNVPKLVMFGCAAVVTVPAVPALPLTEPVIVEDTVRPVNVPTEVILGCAAVVTVPAVVALVAVGTVPVTLAPGILVSPVAAP